MTVIWERLADSVFRCRLPFLDVSVGLVYGRDTAVLVDTGTTPTEARAIAEDVDEMADRRVSHTMLTHNHFDHVLGASAFGEAEIYCPPKLHNDGRAHRPSARRRITVRRHRRRGGPSDCRAVRIRATGQDALIDLGDRTVSISHPGRGHTVHDLIAVVTGSDRPVVFCGDLVEGSGDPSVDADADLLAWPATLERVVESGGEGGENAVFVPGHGAVVDAAFIRRQREWLRTQM